MAKKLNLDEVKDKYWYCEDCGESLVGQNMDEGCECGCILFNCYYPNVDWDFAYKVSPD